MVLSPLKLFLVKSIIMFDGRIGETFCGNISSSSGAFIYLQVVKRLRGTSKTTERQQSRSEKTKEVLEKLVPGQHLHPSTILPSFIPHIPASRWSSDSQDAALTGFTCTRTGWRH